MPHYTSSILIWLLVWLVCYKKVILFLIYYYIISIFWLRTLRIELTWLFVCVVKRKLAICWSRSFQFTFKVYLPQHLRLHSSVLKKTNRKTKPVVLVTHIHVSGSFSEMTYMYVFFYAFYAGKYLFFWLFTFTPHILKQVCVLSSFCYFLLFSSSYNLEASSVLLV